MHGFRLLTARFSSYWAQYVLYIFCDETAYIFESGTFYLYGR